MDCIAQAYSVLFQHPLRNFASSARRLHNPHRVDDIAEPCQRISIPPFCAFSYYLNTKLIPPQITDYEEEHPYPQECPKFDPDYDVPDDLFELKRPAASPFQEAMDRTVAVSIPHSKPLISDYHEVAKKMPITVMRKPPQCKCPCTEELRKAMSVRVQDRSPYGARIHQVASQPNAALDDSCAEICSKAQEEKQASFLQKTFRRRISCLPPTQYDSHVAASGLSGSTFTQLS